MSNKCINFIKPESTKEAYDLLVHCAICGFRYPQASERISELGYYITEDQYTSFSDVLTEQIYIDLEMNNEAYKLQTQKRLSNE